MMLSIEQQILVAASDLNPDIEGLEKLRNLMTRKIDAGRLIDLAVREGLAGLLYRNLLKAGVLDKLGYEQHQKLQSIYYQTVRLNLKLIRELKNILEDLNREDVQVVLMQGIALVQQVYSDVGVRPMKDMDLWILPKDYQSLTDSLYKQGFQREHFYPNTFKKGETAIDIHTHILWADRIKARRLLLNQSQVCIFRNTQKIAIKGEYALCLSPYDQVLYLSLHVLKHNAERLIWLVDIKSLISDWASAEWKGLMHRARELGLEKVLEIIVFLLKDLLGYRLPIDVQPILQSKKLSFLEKAILKRRMKKNTLPSWTPLFLLPAGKGLYKRSAFIFETAFPGPRILRQVFADSPNLKTWQLYWKRGLQLLGFNRTF
jgi:hypothetical protein